MEIICYACGRGEYPENTILAIKNCQAVSPEWRIEMDIQMTKDGRLVLFHDNNTERITGDSRLINELTWSEVKKLNAGFNFKYNDQYIYRKNPIQVPEVEAVFRQFPQAKLLLDIRTSNLDVVDKLVALVEKYSRADKTVIVSRYDKIINNFRKERPVWQYGVPSMEAKRMIYSSFLLLDNFFPIKSDILMLPQNAGKMNVLTKRVLSHAKKRNKKLWVWLYEGKDEVKNVDSKDDLLKMKKLGADGVFTDYPKKLMKELRRNQNYDKRLFVVSSN